jgi:hypothetical protein
MATLTTVICSRHPSLGKVNSGWWRKEMLMAAMQSFYFCSNAAKKMTFDKNWSFY